jgi:nucleotide-binding universal stress UspA family protein
MMRIRKIIVPVDFSDESALALEWAVRLAKEEPDGTLFLVHVLPNAPVFPDPFSAVAWTPAAMAELARDVDERLTDLQARIPPPLTSKAIRVSGPFPDAVCAVAAREGADLVVMTTHGRHGLKRVLHPNATEAVVRNAGCPVLVLHLNPAQNEMAKASIG